MRNSQRLKRERLSREAGGKKKREKKKKGSTVSGGRFAKARNATVGGG